MNNPIARILIASVLLAAPLAGMAEVIKVPLGAQGSAAVAEHLPQRGISMDRVVAGWGEPQARQAAVGEPPITRWDYPEFFVYFEYTHVLHAVMRHHPATPPPAP